MGKMLIAVTAVLIASAAGNALAVQINPVSADASATYGTYVPANAIDGNVDTRWSSGSGSNSWIRLNLGSRFAVTQLDYYYWWWSDTSDVRCIKNYKVYVTNSSSTTPADWGSPVATGTFLNIAGWQTVAIPSGEGKYVVLFGVDCYNWQVGTGELMVFGTAATNPAITQFTVADTSTTRSFMTDGPVTVSIVGDPGAAAITGYAITEAAEPAPTSWSGTSPTSYTIAGDGDIKLYAWVKDANEVVVSQPMAGYILKNATVPNVSDVVFTGKTFTSTVTWTTDTETFGRVGYKKTVDPTYTYTAWETAHSTSHSRVMTGLVPNTAYNVIIENNEKAEAAQDYSHQPGLIEIPKPGAGGTMTADASANSNLAPLAINGILPGGSNSNGWHAGTPGWLRIDLKAVYAITRLTY